ncbi:diguanylate phosphodiesterase [Enterobacter cancerogenus]|uniref:Diguanylate phosphodiesterase n=1 Tax=Enterobacter cancerogenus TaxID=69218 RepID=A0A484XNI6_9ENTR|nr:diguanylate phosphodiesterase [Enterobacter cancerogenus]
MTTVTKSPSTLLSGVSTLLARLFPPAPEKALSVAIHQRQIVPVYQPFFDSQTGNVAGVEVLARWKHPLYGNVAPDIFIPLA